MAPIAAFFIETFAVWRRVSDAFQRGDVFRHRDDRAQHRRLSRNSTARKATARSFSLDLKEGINYYKREKGILGIGCLFAAFSFVYAASDLLRMPFFVNHRDLYDSTLFVFDFRRSDRPRHRRHRPLFVQIPRAQEIR
ncbi:MAG: hypothetical protein MZU97_20310 [Bacillus subtilis]|nr:hypothetical protein [Bacillus subtilis]